MFSGNFPEENRNAAALRSLAPNAAYDAWFPLVFAATEGEALANAGRALVAEEPLATIAGARKPSSCRRWLAGRSCSPRSLGGPGVQCYQTVSSVEEVVVGARESAGCTQKQSQRE